MQLYKWICICLILLLFPLIASAKIVFLSAPTRADNYAIYVMDDDGTNRTLVYNVKPGIYHVRWSPDGQIAFQTSGNIYLINPDKTNLRQLTRDLKGYIPFFAFSPDGKQIVFHLKERIDQKAVRSVQILNVRTSKTTKISDLNVSEFDWSPDGKHILSTSTILLGGEKRGNSIYIMDPNGKNVNELLAPPLGGELNIARWHPRWSPNGKQFVYRQSEYTWEEREPGVISEITKAYRIIISDKEGRTFKRLNVPKNLTASYFAWMDDGKSIIFTGTEFELNEPPPGWGNEPPDHIYRYDLQKNELVRLTLTPKEEIVSVDWISDDVLSVSPQGKKKVTWGTLKKLDSNTISN